MKWFILWCVCISLIISNSYCVLFSRSTLGNDRKLTKLRRLFDGASNPFEKFGHPNKADLIWGRFPSINWDLNNIQLNEILLPKTKESTSLLDKAHRNRRSADSHPNLIVNSFILNGSSENNHGYLYIVGRNVSMKVISVSYTVSIGNGRAIKKDSNVWRSDDNGSTFRLHNDKFRPSATIDSVIPMQGNSRKVMLIDSQAKVVYTSNDLLDTVTSYTLPITPDEFLAHPTDENKVLLYSYRDRKLVVSVDFGKTWELLSDDVVYFEWGSEEYEDPDTVHMELEGPQQGLSIYKSCLVPHCQETNSTVGDVGPFLENSLQVFKDYMFVGKSNLNQTKAYLEVSYKRQPFKRAYFPADVKATNFHVLNADNNQVFVAVGHQDKVNLYLSDATGQFYVTSMEDVDTIIPGYAHFDFHEVEGMNWTYILQKKQEMVGSTVVPDKTYISFDKGGQWKPLQLSDDLKKYCEDQTKCALHLHTTSYPFPMIVSKESAPGLIIAHGNIGEDLKAMGNVSVFTSRDGGWTWKKAPFEGQHHLMILDQGGVLVAVPADIGRSPLDVIYYSCDEGLSWESYEVTDYSFRVVLGYADITTLSEAAILFGRSPEGEWRTLKLNFSQILGDFCQDSDYEQWFPKDYNAENSTMCILGRVLQFHRHKEGGRVCKNGIVPRPKVDTHYKCNCSLEDFECDFGYEESGNTCNKSSWYYVGYSAFTCGPDGTYNQSRGYRKIPSDTCYDVEGPGGTEAKYGPEKVTCPVVAPQVLEILTETKNIESGKDVTFWLYQERGSLSNTTYTWDFNDGTAKLVVQERKVTHKFYNVGHYVITVTASNAKGSATTSIDVHVQEQLKRIYMVVQRVWRMNLPLDIQVILLSKTGSVNTSSDHVHYVWSFGDEPEGKLPSLNWDGTTSHIYSSPGTYTISVEAVNSISSIYGQESVLIVEKAEALALTFNTTGRIFLSEEWFRLHLATILRIKLEELLGLPKKRLALTSAKDEATLNLYVFPPTSESELTIQQVIDQVKARVKAGQLSIHPFTAFNDNSEYPVASFADLNLSDGGASSGPNMKPVYIAAPILILIVIVCAIIFHYCRKRAKLTEHHYSMVAAHDESDAMLDDDDVDPLDLNMDLRARDSRDDSMIDAGGSHLVLVTGGGAENAENC